MNKLITISELSKLLGLIDIKTKKPLNYILRYWEKQFKQIKPIIHNKRRYYSANQVDIIKMTMLNTKPRQTEAPRHMNESDLQQGNVVMRSK